MNRLTRFFYVANARVFISYRRSDSTAYAGHLRSDLRTRFGANQVFMDFDNIAPGAQFRAAIETALGSSTVMVAMIGRLWASREAGGMNRLDDPNDFVRMEIATALARDMSVIPVLVQGATIPDPASLPEELKPLSGRQALKIDDEHWDYDVERLIQSIEDRSPRTLRKARVVIAAMLTIALVVVSAVLINRFSRNGIQTGTTQTTPTPTPIPAKVAAALEFAPGSDIISVYEGDKVRFSIPIVIRNSRDEAVLIMDMKSELKSLLPSVNPVHLLGYESSLLKDGKPLTTPIALQKGNNMLTYSVMFETNEALRSQSTGDFMQELTLKMITSDKERFPLRLCFTIDGYPDDMKEREHSLEECPQ